MTQSMLNPRPFLLLLLVVGAAILLASLANPAFQAGPRAIAQELPPLTDHALRHADAQLAWDWVSNNGRFCRYECPDGRTRYVCGGLPGHRWAVVVLEAARLVTAFTTDQDYARGITDTCHNPWRWAHP